MGKLMKRNIGNILLDGGFILHHDLHCALEEQKHSKELLGQVLIKQGVIKEEDFRVPLLIQEHLGSFDSAVKLAAGERQLLGTLLVNSGRITNEQLDYVVAEQKRSGEKLGETLKRLGMLTGQQLSALLEFQGNQDSKSVSPLRLGELLVATGQITRDQLEDALHRQTTSNKNIGDILVEAGYVHQSGIEYGVRLQKMLLKSTLAAIICLGVNATEPSAYAATGEICSFSTQLQSSPMREQYISRLATESTTLLAYNTSTENEVRSDVSDSFSFSSFVTGEKSDSFSQGGSVDSFSRDCLTCHDGGHASDVKINYRNNPGSKNTKFGRAKDHPIGMDYNSYSAMDPQNYKPVAAFNSKMTFVDGKVGCLTCHNPLKPEKTHLVMSDQGSALCLSCHIK
jgi:predicted CXXCH cytochrome family protein